MIDRRLLGIVTIAFIVSTAAFSFLVGEKVKEPLEVLKNEWGLPTNSEGFAQMPKAEGRVTYSLGIVARKPFGRLELVFATVENSSFKVATNRAAAGGDLATLEEVGAMTIAVKGYVEPSLMRLDRVNFSVNIYGEERHGCLEDLTDPVTPVAPPGIQHSLPTVHAILYAENGSVWRYYRGVPDMFLFRNNSIIDLTVQRNENVTRFSRRTTQQGTSLLMTEAPAVGRLVFDDIRKDDQIFVTVAVNPADPEAATQVMPRQRTLLHFVLIFVDGECYRAVVTPMIW